MKTDDANRPRRPLRSRPLAIVAAAGVLLLLAIAGIAGWLASEHALLSALDYAVARSGGRLTLDQPSGTLYGTLRFARLTWRDGGTEIVAHDVELDYAPSVLPRGRIAIGTLRAKRVVVNVQSADDAPPELPDSLRLPMDVSAGRVDAERVDWRIGERSGALDGVSFGYAGDATSHRVRDLDARATGAHLTGGASVATSRPFATDGTLVLELADPHPRGRLGATLSGDLVRLVVDAKSTLAGIDATAAVTLAPFAQQAIVAGRIDANDVDLARLAADWPVTRLALVVEAVPSPEGFSGHVAAVNALAGTIDANRVPLAEAKAAFALAGRTLAFSDVDARVSGGGLVAGSGSVDLDTGRHRWRLSVRALDLAKLHASLVATSLAGRIDADIAGSAQRVVADVSQKDIRLAIEARYDGTTIVAERLAIQARGGSLEGKGSIALADPRTFTLDARAKRFDPSRFGRFPAGSLDGMVAAKGTLSPRVVAETDIAIAAGSRLADLAAHGRIRGRFAADSVDALDADMTLGSSRLRARGASGRAGNRLAVKFESRRLEELGPVVARAFPTPIAGMLEADATLENTASGFGVAFTARGRRLRIGSDWRFDTLAAEGRGAHAGPWSAIRLEALREVALTFDASDAVTPAGRAARLRLALEGAPQAHRLTFSASNGDQGIEGRVAGALADSGAGATWRGRVESFAAHGLPGVASATLAAPATLELAKNGVVIGAARVEGGGALFELDGLSWRDGALASRGRFRGLPLAPFVAAADLPGRWPNDIVVGGAWAVASEPRLGGTLSIARERGDLYVDDPAGNAGSRIALGLETLSLVATLDGTRLSGNAEMRARLGGNALADFELVAPAGARHPLTTAAAVRGALRAHLPSLATLQPWIGTAARVQGQAIADVAIGGTLAKPALSGQLVGYGLRFDMPQYGVNLKDGRLRVASGPEGVKLEELVFSGGDGTFVASGVLGLPREGGTPSAPSRIEWRAENFRVLNRPDLRLVVDGDGTLGFEAKRLVLRGKLTADEGNIEYRSTADTTLADDIVVVGRAQPTRARPDTALAGNVPLDLDLELTLGRNLRFAGEGLDSRLAGRVQVTSKGGGPILGKGTIRTVRGSYWAFGQKLDIERGRVIFDGPLANPSLDIVALRRNLAVEAGVAISGTVRAPVVRLTSNPPVPDSEKLAWLLTGGPSGSGSARESAALQAATAALVGRGGKPFTQRFAQSVGLDDISVAQRASASTDLVGSQVVTLGKRLSERVYVAYEQGLSLASNAVRIEYVLSRFLTVSAFAGTDSGIALNFRRSWR